MGAGYFLAMVDIARRQTPAAHALAVLDCGSAPGLALAALKAGAQAVQLDAATAVLDKIADIAAQLGASLLRNRPTDILDLRNHPNPLAATSAFLAR
jgi:predicted nicotinamide N-methyase